MTQALNLANFANNLNLSGQASNSGLQNASVTVTAGTGLTGGGAVSLGGSVTLTNSGVTSLIAGTGISLSGSTGTVTISSSAGFTPVQQGGGTGQLTNKLYIGWTGSSTLALQVDSTNFGSVWPISVTGTAAAAAAISSNGGLQNMTAWTIGSMGIVWNDSYYGLLYVVNGNYVLNGRPGSWRCIDTNYAGLSNHACETFNLYISIFVRYA